MPSAPLPPEQQAELEDLTQAIREAVDAEIGELAANLASTDDAPFLGQNEFPIRALAHKSAAKAVEQPLTRKKRRRRPRRDRPALRPSRRLPRAPRAHLLQSRGAPPLPPRLLPLPDLRPGPVPL